MYEGYSECKFRFRIVSGGVENISTVSVARASRKVRLTCSICVCRYAVKVGRVRLRALVIKSKGSWIERMVIPTDFRLRFLKSYPKKKNVSGGKSKVIFFLSIKNKKKNLQKKNVRGCRTRRHTLIIVHTLHKHAA